MATIVRTSESTGSQAPGPRGWPYFGCANALLGNPMTFWSRIARRYGPIARVPLQGHVVYLVSDPDLLYELLVKKRDNYRKNTRYRAAIELFGAGLLLNEGDAWKRQRLISQPAFKGDHVGEQVRWMVTAIESCLDGWDELAGMRRPLMIDEEFLCLAQRLAGRHLLGPAFEPIAERFCAAALAIKGAWPMPPRNVLQAWRRRRAGFPAALAAAIRDIDCVLYEYLAEQRQNDFEAAGFVRTLVHASREQGEEFDDRSLRDQILTLFYAGHETSAMSLTWTQYLLAKHPDVRRRMQVEARTVLGTRIVTHADLDRLEYTEQVLNESLRMYSPIHSISRVALKDDVLGGYKIPAGATIYISLCATHRLPRLWPDPERFDPDRFAPERIAERPRFAFIPFAAGHRNCIGATAAVAEVKLVLALLARRYEFQLVPGQRVEGSAGTTMHPRYGLKMYVNRVSTQ